jgi:hypothetical protein
MRIVGTVPCDEDGNCIIGTGGHHNKKDKKDPSFFSSLEDTLDDPVATPLPAALPLFATGLGGLGLLRWRRKRKAQA